VTGRIQQAIESDGVRAKVTRSKAPGIFLFSASSLKKRNLMVLALSNTVFSCPKQILLAGLLEHVFSPNTSKMNE